MVRLFSLSLFALLVAIAPTTSALAAVPTPEVLSPPGGTRGTTVTVTAVAVSESWPCQIFCSRPELQFKVLDEKGKFTVTIPADCAPGVAWIRLHNAEGAAPLRPFVIGTLPEVAEVEPNNELAKAQVLPSTAVVVQGQPGAREDVDNYAVNLKAGQTLVADFDGNRTLGAACDGVLQIVSPDGFVLEQNDDDQGLDPRIAFTAPVDGRYYVRTFSFPAATDSSVNFAGSSIWHYRLTITTERFTDFTLPLAATRATAGEVEARGWNLGAEPVKVAIPATDADEISLLVPQSGNYITLPTVPHPVLVELEPNALAQPNAIPVPVGISGIVSAPDDADYFRFPAKKGQPLLVKVTARSQGSLIDPVVAICDATGKELQRLDDQGDKRDPELTWNPPADGDYLLTVTDLHHRGGPRFYYHVNISLPKPDYRITVAADRFVLPIDKPLEIPITVERLGGFKDEIEVSVTGLPEGVTAVAVKSLAEGETSKAVKLVISGNPGPFSVPLQITATSTAEPKVIRKPTFKLTQYELDTNYLWLTVLKKP